MDFHFPRTSKFLVVGAIAVGGLGIIFWPRGSNPGSTVNTKSNPARETYADLYQAAWRPDQRQGAVLMTATLFSPDLRAALGNDSARSETEDQLWRALEDITPRHIGVYLTIDSVQGPVTDAVIKAQANLSDEQKTVYSVGEWKPLIAPSRVVNGQSGTSSQSGVLIFSADEDISWEKLSKLVLTIRDLADQPQRQFIWVQPGQLLRAAQ